MDVTHDPFSDSRNLRALSLRTQSPAPLPPPLSTHSSSSTRHSPEPHLSDLYVDPSLIPSAGASGHDLAARDQNASQSSNTNMLEPGDGSGRAKNRPFSFTVKYVPRWSKTKIIVLVASVLAIVCSVIAVAVVVTTHHHHHHKDLEKQHGREGVVGGGKSVSSSDWTTAGLPTSSVAATTKASPVAGEGDGARSVGGTQSQQPSMTEKLSLSFDPTTADPMTANTITATTLASPLIWTPTITSMLPGAVDSDTVTSATTDTAAVSITETLAAAAKETGVPFNVPLPVTDDQALPVEPLVFHSDFVRGRPGAWHGPPQVTDMPAMIHAQHGRPPAILFRRDGAEEARRKLALMVTGLPRQTGPVVFTLGGARTTFVTSVVKQDLR